jgi:hypothetical protein
MIPQSYSAWRHCIEVDCGIALTEAFIRERIAALHDPHDFRTEQFIRCYGQAHLERVRVWFAEALRVGDPGAP